MNTTPFLTAAGVLCLACLGPAAARPARAADTVLFDTGAPDGLLAAAARPASASKIEIESADDFLLTGETLINKATFTGLLTGGATAADIGQVAVQIYRVFPNDSDTVRTPAVPTRVNSPSDVAFDSRDSASTLTFTVATLTTGFTAANSIAPGGIHAMPNQHTGGNGAVTGDEVQFTVTFATPFDLPADHYFFVPEVQVDGGEFMWLSAPKPNVTTPIIPDLQSWIRDENLDPDWLRIGTDIVGGATPPTYNMSFSLIAVPEPATLGLLTLGAAALLTRRRS